MIKNILVLNPGSSTLKFGLFRSESKEKIIISLRGEVDIKSPLKATEEILERLSQMQVDAVGCRVVHGGKDFSKTVVLDLAALKTIRNLSELAPLHNSIAADVIETWMKLLPNVPVVGVFDTVFHQTLPKIANTYALPRELSEKYNLRRYGFHGISHQYISKRLTKCLNSSPVDNKFISCHLGNGASISAIKDGKSIDTSMGLTPLEGLIMGSRSGDVDPGLVLYLMEKENFSPEEIRKVLNEKSGLLGLSGRSKDVRELELAANSGDKDSEFALESFAYRAAKYIGAYVVALEGIDALAFSGGIGEHSADMRKRICKKLNFFGLELDEKRNKEATGKIEECISSKNSKVKVFVIPTNEELEIASEVLNIL